VQNFLEFKSVRNQVYSIRSMTDTNKGRSELGSILT